MRKIFRIASFALLLAVGVACSTDDVPQEPLGTYPILFRCMDETRAVATVGSMEKDTNGFAVYAFFTNNAINASQSFNKTVKYDDASGKWLYSGLEYWIPGATYYFKAVYPTTIDYAVDNSSTTQPLTITGYDITNQYDILVAEAGPLTVDPVVGAPTESGSVVSLQFKHLLACIDIKIKSAISGLTIKKVTIGNADNLGKYSNDEWTSASSVDIEVDSDVELTVGADFVSVVGDGVLVIPASPADKYLAIEASNGKTYEVDFPSTVAWKKGKKYSYTLEIKQSNIVFSEPKVDEWDSENATGSVIIK